MSPIQHADLLTQVMVRRLARRKEYRVKPSIYIGGRHLWFSAGWFPGDPFILFRLSVLEPAEWVPGRAIDWMQLFGIQIARLSLTFGWRA